MEEKMEDLQIREIWQSLSARQEGEDDKGNGDWAAAPSGGPAKQQLSLYEVDWVPSAELFPHGSRDPVALPVAEALRLDPGRFRVEDANAWSPLGVVPYQPHGLILAEHSGLTDGAEAGVCALMVDTRPTDPAPVSSTSAAPVETVQSIGHAESPAKQREHEDPQQPEEPAAPAPVRRVKLSRLIKAGLLEAGDELFPEIPTFRVSTAGTIQGPHGESLFEPEKASGRWMVRRQNGQVVSLQQLRRQYLEEHAD